MSEVVCSQERASDMAERDTPPITDSTSILCHESTKKCYITNCVKKKIKNEATLGSETKYIIYIATG